MKKKNSPHNLPDAFHVLQGHDGQWDVVGCQEFVRRSEKSVRGALLKIQSANDSGRDELVVRKRALLFACSPSLLFRFRKSGREAVGIFIEEIHNVLLGSGRRSRMFRRRRWSFQVQQINWRWLWLTRPLRSSHESCLGPWNWFITVTLFPSVCKKECGSAPPSRNCYANEPASLLYNWSFWLSRLIYNF